MGLGQSAQNASERYLVEGTVIGRTWCPNEERDRPAVCIVPICMLGCGCLSWHSYQELRYSVERDSF